MHVSRKPTRGKLAVLAITLVAAFVPAASASADLTISQTTSSKWVKKGGLVTITVTVRNDGPGELNGNVSLFSLSPGGGGSVNDPYQSVTPSQGSCRPNSTGGYQVEDCSFGADLPQGAQAQVVAVVRVNESMDHNATPEQQGYGNWSTVSVAASVPPVLSGPKQIKLRGLPAGCVQRDFKLTIAANLPQARTIVAQMSLGTDNNGFGIEWRRARNGNRMTVTVPVSRISEPSIGKTYQLQVYVQRRANTTLGRTVEFGLCQDANR